MQAERHLGGGVGEPDRDPRLATVAEGLMPASGRGHFEGAALYRAGEGGGEKFLRQHGNSRAVDLLMGIVTQPKNISSPVSLLSIALNAGLGCFSPEFPHPHTNG